LAQLRRLYYWPGMRRDIDAWCRQCEGCAISRGPPSRPHGRLRKVYAGAPMDLVAIDILSGLPTTPDGHKYLLVATDYFTKWLEAIPLCDAEAHTCMRALYSTFFSRFGLPRQLQSDQGSNFESKLVAEPCSFAGIKKTRTTPFHPRSDGQTERANRTILQMLRASIDAQPESWPDRLPAASFSHRSAAGGARRSKHIFCGRISAKHAQCACVRPQRDQPRCENSKELLRQTRQGTAVCTKSISVALLATPFATV